MSGENTVSSDEKALDVETARNNAAKAIAASLGNPAFHPETEDDPAWDGPREALLQDAATAVSVVWSEVERLAAERDRARSVAVALEQELARRDQALDEIRALAVAWTDGMGEEIKRSSLSDIDFYAILRAAGMNKAGTEVQRILSDLAAALDAHLNKEDDDQ